MAYIQKSSVAHVLLGPCSDINFAHVVGEMQRSLGEYVEATHSLEWKEDDIAIFDLETTRIVFAIESFAYSSKISNSYSSCLMVSVGPPLDSHSTKKPNPPHDKLSQMIVNRISAYYGVAEVIWQTYEAPMTAEAIDALMTDLPIPEIADDIEEAPDMTMDVPEVAEVADLISKVMAEEEPSAKIIEFELPDQEPSAAVRDAQKARESLSDYQNLYQDVANSVPDLPRHDIARLSAIRAALYAEDDDGIKIEELASTRTRLAVSALDVTMVMVCLPVGAAMLTYHVLKGGEMRRCAQMMTLTGLFLSVTNTSLGQQMLALI
jgi:hypothetical protein